MDMSCKSESKSSRGFSSVSTGSDEKNPKKKKKAAQRTLGMAWGSNSNSSSRSSFGKSPFSDFGSYMVVKNQKLHEQFDAAASSSSHSDSNPVKSIFHGVAIFVDGYTVPSSQELRGYMLKYGGHFENYFSRHRVTHIICSNLPSSKIKNLRAFSGGLPVVKPNWVLDSVAANKLLSWIPYQLDLLATGNDSQSKLLSFFSLQNSRGSKDECSLVDVEANSETENTLLNELDSSLSDEHKSLEKVDRCCVEEDDLLHANISKLVVGGPAGSVESHCEIKDAELSNNALERRKSVHTPQDFDVASSSRTIFSPNQRHSTLEDPNFVDNYFKNSRLHFIGTWRTRYRKRFPNSCAGLINSTSNIAAVTEKAVIIHIDLDCFFVSVVIRHNTELQAKPVAVCHSNNPRGTAEISSANYPARNHGVKAGMFVKDARVRCPDLVIVPYDFGAYEKVADQFYDILHKHCNKVQAVSCDEAFLDVSESEEQDPQLLASIVRKEIFDTTGCTASAGIGSNMLVARLATKTAKPNGQFYLPSEKVDSYLCTLPVSALPGIGHVLQKKLKKVRVETCGQLQLVTKESLQKDFGMRTGEMLWNYCRGIDNRLVGVIQESKSIGAEVNWGVRFRNPDDTWHFLSNLSKEVALRLQGSAVQGRCFTLKLKKRRADSGEPVKYMGCGNCENLSHSITIPVATDDVDVLQRLATQLFGYFRIDVRDIRGMGFQVSKLESSEYSSKLVHKRNSIFSWFASSSSTKNSDQIVGPSNLIDAGDLKGASLSSSETGVSDTITLPPLHDLDMTVVKSLPPEVVSEINDMYGGELFGMLSENKGKIVDTNVIHDTYFESEVAKFDDKESFHAHEVKSNTIAVDTEVEDLRGGKTDTEVLFDIPVDDTEKVMMPSDDHKLRLPSLGTGKSLMPSSLSQVDSSALQQLPEDLRKNILELLPPHRGPEFLKCSSSNISIKGSESVDFDSGAGLWLGNPPRWIHKFKIRNCHVLNLVAKIYQSGNCNHMSSLLQCLVSNINSNMEVDNHEQDCAVSCLYELLKQYIDLKIETDMEEIHFCLCLLTRLAKRSKCFEQVYEGILPYLQASMNEKYGGTLNVPSVKG